MIIEFLKSQHGDCRVAERIWLHLNMCPEKLSELFFNPDLTHALANTARRLWALAGS